MHKYDKYKCLTMNIGFNAHEAEEELPKSTDSIDINKIINQRYMYYDHKRNCLQRFRRH